MENGNWKEASNFNQPLPESITSIVKRLLALSSGRYLLIAASNKNNKSIFLIFDGSEWIETCGPYADNECTIGDIIIHNGAVYLIERKADNCHLCHRTPLKSLLNHKANSSDWNFLYVFDKHSNLIVAGGHVVTVTYNSPHKLYILRFSIISDSWIELKIIECTTEIYTLPTIVGVDNGKLLLMGKIKAKESMSGGHLQASTSNTSELAETPQFDVLELTPKASYYYHFC